ncbi:hypothetical protein Rcae01_02079 [Novipirellula caenicola]|uniref:Secreted protein n=1 Tax=Novipirellula caenicola TaxID=1536901 RepID=A0ABP9VN66_9BACT
MNRRIIAALFFLAIVSGPYAAAAGGLFHRCRLFRSSPVHHAPTRVICYPRAYQPTHCNRCLPLHSRPCTTGYVMPSYPSDGSVRQMYSSEPPAAIVTQPNEVFPWEYPSASASANGTDTGMDTGNDDENPIGNGGRQGNGG